MSATLTLPEPVATVLAGGPVDPDDYAYGSVDPSPLLQVPPGTLYVNTTTLKVWWLASGHACDTSFGVSVDGGSAAWIEVADYTPYVQRTTLLDTAGDPIAKDIRFTRGEEFNDAFLFQGLCWTPARPEINGVPIPDPDPSNPLAVGTLPVPWQQKFWLAEIRDNYLSSVRYYNGWVPWYGTWPNWVWWEQHSLTGVFEVTAEWDPVNVGTLVRVKLHSAVSNRVRPSRSYHWDLESASGREFDTDGNPTRFQTIKTWVKGRARVDPVSTLIRT